MKKNATMKFAALICAVVLSGCTTVRSGNDGTGKDPGAMQGDVPVMGVGYVYHAAFKRGTEGSLKGTSIGVYIIKREGLSRDYDSASLKDGKTFLQREGQIQVFSWHPSSTFSQAKSGTLIQLPATMGWPEGEVVVVSSKTHRQEDIDAGKWTYNWRIGRYVKTLCAWGQPDWQECFDKWLPRMGFYDVRNGQAVNMIGQPDPRGLPNMDIKWLESLPNQRPPMKWTLDATN